MKYFKLYWFVAIATVPLFCILLSIQQWILGLVVLGIMILTRMDFLRVIVRSSGCGKAPHACDSKTLLSEHLRLLLGAGGDIF